MASGWVTRFNFWKGHSFSLSHYICTSLGADQVSCTVDARCDFSRSTVGGADHSPPSLAVVNIEWSLTSAPHMPSWHDPQDKL